MSPYQPADGGRARWTYIYDRLKELAPDDLLSYEDMGRLVDLDPIENRAGLHSAARRAVQELETKDNRTCRIERGVGYRIATPEHQVAAAVRHQGLAERHIGQAHKKITIIDLNGLDPEAAKAVGLMAHCLAEQGRFMRATTIRQDNLEEAVRAVAHGVDARMEAAERRTAEELAAVRERLDRLTQQVAGQSQPPPQPPSQPASHMALPPAAPPPDTPAASFGPLFTSPGRPG